MKILEQCFCLNDADQFLALAFPIHSFLSGPILLTLRSMGNRSIPLTESISVTNVADSHQAPLSQDVEFTVRVTDTNTQRFTFTISQKIPGTPRTVPLLSENQVIDKAHRQLRRTLREGGKVAEDREIGKRLQDLADEY